MCLSYQFLYIQYFFIDMKKLMLVLFSIVIYGFCSAQSKEEVQKKAVEQTIIGLFESLSDNDSVSLKTLTTPDILLFEYGRVWTLDTLLALAYRPQKAKDFKRINTINFISTSIAKNTAWSTYRNKAEITSNGKQRIIEWIETVVLVRSNKKWRIKLLHSSVVKQS
jgi:hypothetical protein